MSRLPRELETVLDEPNVTGAVQRTWVRLERTRAGTPSAGRLVLLSSALAAAVAGFVLSRPVSGPREGAAAVEPQPARVPAPAQTQVVAAPAPLASAMLQGRARRVARRVSAEAPTADPVGHFLEGAVEAFTEGHVARAAALLGRVSTEFPDDPRTPEALVTLGWLQLEHLELPHEAKGSLEKAMESSLSQELFDRAWPLLQKAQARAAQRRD
ncbi:MAG: hypothetical protein MUC96_11865 [Myxococcaceae bacterium]|jgi:hypothetical protein|nr:hypothetical protein [Myxococcaceae bacterium]